MADTIEITLAQADDAETLADISKRSFDSDTEVGALGPGGPPGYDSVEVHEKDTHSEHLDYWKVLYNGRIVGGTRAYKVSSEHIYIYGVFVDPDFHRMGIGAKFFSLIENNYPHAKKWTLDTPVWNVRTKGFYEKIGFVQVGVLRWVPDFELRYFVKINDASYLDEDTSISKLSDGMKGLRVEGVVENISEVREVTSSKDGEKKRVANMTLRDDTGSITLVLWNDMIRQVCEGERVIIERGYAKDYNGQLQLSISNGQIIILQH